MFMAAAQDLYRFVGTYTDYVVFPSGHEKKLLSFIKWKGINTPKNNTIHAEVKKWKKP